MEVQVDYEDLKECFEGLQDPRAIGRTTHPLEAILFLTLCAVLCGMDDWESIEQWGNNRVQWLSQFIEALDLTGSIVTLEAMGCQKEIAAAIVGKQADYVLALKGNQDTLCRQVKRLFDTTEWLNYRDFGTMGHATQGSTSLRRAACQCACPGRCLGRHAKRGDGRIDAPCRGQLHK